MAITSEILNPLVKSFYDDLTPDQWEMLKSGSPDINTKSNLAKLLFDIIQSVSNNLIKSVNNVQVKISQEEVEKSLGESLPISFAEGLGVEVDMDEQSNTLTSLVASEVAESLKSAFSTSKFSDLSISSKPIGQSPVLNNMLEHALSMLKVFMAKVKDVMTPKVRTKEPLSTDLTVLKQNLPLDGTFLGAVSEAVQQILRKEMHDMTQPILKDMMDVDDEQLQTSMCAEIKVMSDEIAQLLSEEMKEQERSVAEGSRSKNKHALRRTRKNIKRFFTKCFTRAWLIYIVAQLRRKYGFRPLKPNSSMQSLIASVDALLKFEDGGRQPGNEDSVSTIFKGNDQIFSKDLSDLVYDHINNCGPKLDTDSSVDSVSWSSSSSTVSETPSAIQRTVQHRVQGFLTLVRWWWDTQADSHSKMVCEVLAKVQLRGPLVKLEEDKTKKMMVGILVEKVVLRTLNKAKVSCEVANPLTISQGLLEKVWSEVRGLDFDVSQETLKDFEKVVFNELLEQWGSAELIVALMRLERQDFKNSFTLLCRERLVPSTKRNAVCRFFSRSSK